MTTTLICDTREPWPHPWAEFMPEAKLERVALETGDFALSGLPEGAVIERKTVPDFLACLTRERDRFTRELMRSRFCHSFTIVVEGSLPNVLRDAGGTNHASIIGSVAAWIRRGWPIVFAGSPAMAAMFTYRYLVQQIADAQKILKHCDRDMEQEEILARCIGLLDRCQMAADLPDDLAKEVRSMVNNGA